MNGKKVKAIRRAMRAELEKGTKERWISHPTSFINVKGERMLHFNFQYVIEGGKKLVKLAKKIYRLSGILPRNETV